MPLFVVLADGKEERVDVERYGGEQATLDRLLQQGDLPYVKLVVEGDDRDVWISTDLIARIEVGPEREPAIPQYVG